MNVRGSRISRAFTLLEVLIATAIFAVVMAAISTVFQGALRLRTTTARVVEQAIPINHALSLLKGDIRSLLAPGTQGVLAGAIAGGRQSSMQGRSQLNLRNDFVYLQFCTTTGLTDDSTVVNGMPSSGLLDNGVRPWPEVQKVTYYLADPIDLTNRVGRDLVRATSRNLLATLDEIPYEQTVLTGVETLEFLFYDGTAWQDSWNSTNGTTATVPKAIKVLIDFASEFRDGRLRKPPIELTVPIVTQVLTNQASGGGSNTPAAATGGQGGNTPGGGGQGGGSPGGGSPGGGSPGGGSPGGGSPGGGGPPTGGQRGGGR